VNILFVNYGDFTTNSLNHIGGFARALSAGGHACVVAVPSGMDTLSTVPSPGFTPALYNELLERPAFFPDGRTADVIHAWTPREFVRKFVVSYQRIAARAARLVVHLEDNEEYLISGYAKRPIMELRSMGFADLDAVMSDRLPHPLRHRTFLRMADAATVIVRSLREFVPAGVPFSVLEPGVDPQYLRSAAADPALRRELGLRAGEKVVVFTGSNTFANEPEMLELYEAVRTLNQRGTPTRLVRTGFNRPPFLESLTPELKAHVIDLGFIAKARLPRLLALADVLVQPGRPGPFNDYRLPSKLPEYLASGRPVVLPATNIALGMRDGEEAIFLSSGTPDDIADCCERVFGDTALAEALGKKGAAFARKHFDLERNTAALLKVYHEAAARPPKRCWEVIRATNGSDLTAAAYELADAVAPLKDRNASAADLAALAACLADIVRIEDERQSSAVASRDMVRLQLEETVRHLELQRDLTSQHAHNLEEKIEHQDRHLKLQKKLSDRHILNLEARIGGIEKLARAEREQAAAAAAAHASEAQAAAQAAGDEHRRLVERILEMDAELRAREERLKSIVHSRSYKLAAPLRDVERLWRRLAQRSRPEPAPAPAPAPASPDTAPQPAIPAPPPEAEAPRPSYQYTFNIDHPRSWSTASNKLLLLGWCYENSAAPIRGIRAQFAGRTTVGIYGSKRLDVLASTGMKQSEYSGIKVDVPTALGDHPLLVEVQHDDGWSPLFQKMVHVGRAGDPTERSDYEKWCEHHEALDEADLKAIRGHIEAFRTRPVISVVMPVFDPAEGLLAKTIQSVLDQVYPHWELCIADDASTLPHVREVIERFASREPRIKVVYRPANGHICEATNTALELASGEMVALFDHDDVLSPTALYEVAAELDAHPDAQLIYSDEDKIDMEDRRFDPYFKPDWNPDLALGQNYISHLTVYRTELLRGLGGFRKGFEGSQDWDLILRAVERIPAASIRHIPKLLYHWRAVPGSTALQLTEKSYPVEAARRALEDHFQRLGERVELVPVPGDHWRIRYPLPSPAPLVSLIIPTRNAVTFVRQALRSILDKTDYPNFEVIVVDNNSDEPETIAFLAELTAGSDPRIRVLGYGAPFNYSAINNFAVREAHGDVVGLLNNDIEVINGDWLSEMVSQAVRPGIGAVGAMLYYPLNTVQHAGVILGLGGVAGHPFKEFPRGDHGQKNRLRLVQNYSAVTAASMVIRKDRFLEVGGFNEKDLPIAFNDVDLCCKLIAAGYRNLWTPHAEFYHHESATRGVEDTPEKKARFQSEIDYMMNTWGSLLMNDPAYNPNLTLVGEDFSPAYLSRATKAWTAHLP
jgi:glycosyltransferase involved in cell wall biosynthesis